MEGFTSHQATRLTGCTPRQLRYWDQIGLVTPSVQQTGGRPGVPRLYSFRDLVALRVVKSLLDFAIGIPGRLVNNQTNAGAFNSYQGFPPFQLVWRQFTQASHTVSKKRFA